MAWLNALFCPAKPMCNSPPITIPAKIHLVHDRSAHIRERIVDRKGDPAATAEVSVVGYESEAVSSPRTMRSRRFTLRVPNKCQFPRSRKIPAVLRQWAQAGDQPHHPCEKDEWISPDEPASRRHTPELI